MQDEYIDASLRGIERLFDINSVIGEPINTPSGVTVIPITKLTAGIVSGTVDYDQNKKSAQKTSGGGGGTGVAITPIAFLAVTADANIKLISLSEDTSLSRIASAIENAPIIIEKIKDALS